MQTEILSPVVEPCNCRQLINDQLKELENLREKLTMLQEDAEKNQQFTEDQEERETSYKEEVELLQFDVKQLQENCDDLSAQLQQVHSKYLFS